MDPTWDSMGMRPDPPWSALRRPPPATWADLVCRLGKTPLVSIRAEIGDRQWTVRLKLEGANPFGSIKDRTAYGLIRSLELEHARASRLAVVESTSGNLGVALAWMCALRGHSFIAVVDPLVAPDNLALIEAAGARIVLVTGADDTGNYLAARIEQVRQICTRNPAARWSNQYARAANPQVHYLQTGPELLRQAGSRLDLVVLAVSTGGTLAGVASFLRSASPSTTVLGVDVMGSAALGGAPGRRLLTGIGASQRSLFVGDRHLDGRTWVDDATAIATCRMLAAGTGLCLGGSSGAVLAACMDYLGRHPRLRHPVCVCPDDGTRYRHTIYNDTWITEHDIDLNQATERLTALGLRFAPA